MSIASNIKDEVTRAPLTVAATILGVVVAALALLVAWLQYAGAPATVSTVGAVSPHGLNLSNLVLATSFFLAATFAMASLVRLLERSKPFHAAVLSVPAAVISSFSTMVVLTLAPPRGITEQAFVATQDAVYYGTLLIFVALNGYQTVRDLATATDRAGKSADAEKERANDGIGALLFAGLLLVVWGSLVSAGLSRLVKAFLA